MIIQYWNSSISIGIWIAVFWVMFTAINFIPVKWYGEMEYWFVSIKVITILGFLIFAVRTCLFEHYNTFPPEPTGIIWGLLALWDMPHDTERL
jgi:amino acid permease